MDTNRLKRFAQYARRSLIEQVEAKLKQVLAPDSATRREAPEAMRKLEKLLGVGSGQWEVGSGKKGKGLGTDHWSLVTEQVAYTWFNRFCALRFMDVKGYNRVRVVSPLEGQFQPEILAEAKMGHVDEDVVPEKTRQRIFALLEGSEVSPDPQTEAYRLLIVAVCNSYQPVMPYLFERIDDYTELLMPDDLLSGNSILALIREAMTPVACGEGDQGTGYSGQGSGDRGRKLATENLSLTTNDGGVEVLGWLYQFYISEKKDEVFADLKKNKKITPENIPAATQLFTPHWIVRYLVENSLGRLWMLNRPQSKLIEQMEYYIQPAEDEVGSGQWTVDSDQSSVSSQTGGRYGEKLQGSDRLAKSDGSGGGSVSDQQGISEGRTIRTNQSDSEGSSFDSVQHSGGASSSVKGGVSQLSFDRSGVSSRSGNSTIDSDASQLSLNIGQSEGIATAGGNQQDASGFTQQTTGLGSSDQGTGDSDQGENWTLATENCSLKMDYLKLTSPEEIKICDPACGSGHMLTYAFDLLYAIYEEEGYAPSEIPEKILTHNLYGIEIDKRAGALAAFALTMKAREKQRRFFRKPVQPNICVLEAIRFEDGELKDYMDFIGRDLFTAPLLETLHQFREADNFGSLIRPTLTDVGEMLRLLEEKDVGQKIFLYPIHQKVLQVLQQVDYLSPKYHVVVANPPYMGGKGMNPRLSAWAKDNYPDSKSDLFSMFIERNTELAKKYGYISMITMQSWMFLSSYEKLRYTLLSQQNIETLIQIGYNSFPELNSKVAQACAFILVNSHTLRVGLFLNLNDGSQSANKKDVFFEKKANLEIYRASANDFKKIPGAPIAYWTSHQFRNIYKNPLLESITISDGQNKTGKNESFVRMNWEIERQNVGIKKRWFFYAKGGGFRRWHGNIDEVVDWSEKAREHYRIDKICRIIPEYLWYKEGVTWGLITSSKPSFRILPKDSTFDVAGSSIFFKNDKDINYTLGLLNTKLVLECLAISNPTLSLQVRNIREVPYLIAKDRGLIEKLIEKLIDLSRNDWNLYEISWSFEKLPLIFFKRNHSSLKTTYTTLRQHWAAMTLEMQRLEEENNRIFIEAYGLQDEITPEVPLNEITLTCNPYYRYGLKVESGKEVGSEEKKLSTLHSQLSTEKTFPYNEELEQRLLADTMKEFISYAVGCMFGRYSLDKPGLILANQGEAIEDYYRKIREQGTGDSDQKAVNREQEALTTDHLQLTANFPPDEDNVIPILDDDWFSDDISDRFRQFLRVTFGKDHYDENLRFLEKAIGKDIRKYFLKDFYTDHVKRYKKRPIYWLFSSPKGSFNALIYMHRYRADTVSVVLNDYLREFRTKLAARQANLEEVSNSASASASEKTKALKEIEKLKKTLVELEDYEREVLYPLATQQIEIDLDDGVKVNYAKFGNALKKIPGMS